MNVKVICPYCAATEERPEGVEMELYNTDSGVYYNCPVCASRSPLERAAWDDGQERCKAEGRARLAALRRFVPRLKPLTWDEATEDDYYLEIKGEKYIDVALLTAAFATAGRILPCDNAHFRTHDEDDLKLLGVDYGKTWRCWPRRPTEAECAAAKWADESAAVELPDAAQPVKVEQPKEETRPRNEFVWVPVKPSEGAARYVDNITVCGWIAHKLQITHEIEGKPFYEGELLVKRYSGTVDTLRLLIPGNVYDAASLSYTKPVGISGEIRTYKDKASHLGEGKRTLVKVFARSMVEVDTSEGENDVELAGVLCKTPIYRETPGGKAICEMLVAIEYGMGKTCYIPCIAWGACAQRVAAYKVGTRVRIEGRLQSRDYQKLTQNCEYETYTVHEVSAYAVYVDNVGG